MKKRVGLLYGGKSAEHEVSLTTATAVTKAIDFDKYEVYPIYISLDGQWHRGPQLTAPAESIEQLQFNKTKTSKPNNIIEFIADENGEQASFDVIFPLLHGTNGEDGTVQGLLEVLNLPYVGNGVLASSAGMDKVVMKQLFEIAGLKQVPFVYFIRHEWDEVQEDIIRNCEKQLTYPMFVKPTNRNGEAAEPLAQQPLVPVARHLRAGPGPGVKRVYWSETTCSSIRPRRACRARPRSRP